MLADEKEGPTPQELGGAARREALTPQRRSEIARKAAIALHSIPRATHEGILTIGGVKIECAVLDGGRRVLTQSGFMRALGRARQAKGRQYYDADVNLPAFLTAKNLKPFISDDLEVSSSQIEFRTLKGIRAFGYPAELLPKVCDVFLDAKEAKALAASQLHVAEQARILSRGLSHVGIAALVDEATGFQEVRDRQALQQILDAYLAREFAAWAKRFPDEFYQEIFRLRGWQWRGMKVNRPPLVGKLTNDVVYARIAPGVLRELQDRNPKDERGYRKAAHHQWLTEDVGHPALAQHLHAVIALMRASEKWEQFKTMLDKALPKRTRLDDLPLFAGSPSSASGAPAQ